MGREWSAQTIGLTGSVNKMKAEKSDAVRAQTELQSILTADAQPLPLDKALSIVMLDVFNNRVEHGVLVSNTTPAKLAGGGASNKLDVLTEDVPGTNVHSVRINVTGTYTTYQGLMDYLDSLKNHPVAVVRLKVQDQAFEVALRVYGTKN